MYILYESFIIFAYYSNRVTKKFKTQIFLKTVSEILIDNRPLRL